MDWFSGVVVYILVWWTALFAVLPIGTRPVAEADNDTGGWRGAPERPLLGWKILGTTVLSAVIWLGIYGIAESGWVSFREGWWAYEGADRSSPIPGVRAQN